jgi:hypothetical protein
VLESRLRRNRVSPSLATDPQRVPDVIGLEFESPVEERAMRLFFGEIGVRGVDARI